MSSLPILLMNPRILLVGGGRVAFRKAEVLLDNQLEFEIIAQTYIKEFDQLGIEKSCKSFAADDLKGFDIVVDATGEPTVAQTLRNEKQKRCLLVNFAADPENSDFFFSALINYGDLKVAVSTEGASPTIARFVRDKIKEFLPQNINNLLRKLAAERKAGIVMPEASLKQIKEVFADGEEEKPR